MKSFLNFNVNDKSMEVVSSKLNMIRAKGWNILQLQKYSQIGGAIGTQESEKIHDDIFMALIWVKYLYSNYEDVSEWLDNLLKDEIGELFASSGLSEENPVNYLQSYFQQKNSNIIPTYSLVNISGPDNKRNYKVVVYCSNELIGKGAGYSIKEARAAAAKDAMSNIISSAKKLVS